MDAHSSFIQSNPHRGRLVTEFKEFSIYTRKRLEGGGPIALKSKPCVTIGDVAQYTEAEFMRGPGSGPKSRNEVKKVLRSLGLRFRPYPISSATQYNADAEFGGALRRMFEEAGIEFSRDVLFEFVRDTLVSGGFGAQKKIPGHKL